MDPELPRLGKWRRALAVLACGGVAALLSLGDPPGTTQLAAAAPARQHVRFWHMWAAEWQVVVDRIVARFNQSQSEYWVDALLVPPAGAESKFLLAVVGGDPPDVMAQWLRVIPTWAGGGMLTPLDSLMSEQDRQVFQRDAYPVARRIGSYGGHLYGMTIGVNAWALYYRKDHLREIGADPEHMPDTLEGLFTLARKLERVDNGGNLTRVGFLPPAQATELQHLAPLFRGGFFDEASGELRLDTPENRRALGYLVEQRAALGLERVTRFDSAQNAGFGLEWPFVTGSVSMTLDGQWRVEQLAKYAPNLEYGVMPVPPPAGGQALAGFSDGNFMLVPRGAKQARGAWAFIRFWSGLADPEQAAELHTWGGWLPAMKSVASARPFTSYVGKYPQLSSFVELLQSPHVQTPPPVPYQTFLIDRIGAAAQSAGRGDLSAEAALERLEREVHDEQARRKNLGHAD